MTTSINDGGFGMIDLTKLDSALKLKALSRLYISNHPFLKLIKERINFEKYYFLESKAEWDKYSLMGIMLLNKLRLELLSDSNNYNNSAILTIIRNLEVKTTISNIGKQSLIYYGLRNERKVKIKDLNVRDYTRLERFLECKIKLAIKEAIRMNVEVDIQSVALSLVKNSKIFNLEKMSSKEIRVFMEDSSPRCT